MDEHAMVAPISRVSMWTATMRTVIAHLDQGWTTNIET
jgi:hypothetical protein